MEYFSAATRQQHNTYQPLPAALTSVLPASSASSQVPASASASASSSTSSIPAFLAELLPSSALSAVHSKLLHRFLQLAATEASSAPALPAAALPAERQRRQQQNKAKKGRRATAARPLSARQRSQLQLLSPPAQPAAALRYSSFLSLHRLWLAYVRDLLGQPYSAIPLSAGERLLRADHHGARVTVARSTAASCVHTSGIVIHESASGWRVIGEDDVVRVVRKQGSVLQLDISAADGGGWQVELYGDQLAVRSAERAAKKWKGKSTIQLHQ